jgi:hypothetical protein
MMGARRIDPDALIAYRYQMWTEGLFRAGPALAIGAFSIEALAVDPQMRQVNAHSATASPITNKRLARFLAFPVCILLIASCAANTGVVPNGSGSYVVAKQAATGFPGLGNLKAEALDEANHYCSSLPGSAHQLFVTHATETQPPYVLGKLS